MGPADQPRECVVSVGAVLLGISGLEAGEYHTWPGRHYPTSL